MTDAIVSRCLYGPSWRHDRLLRFFSDRPSSVMAGADE